MYPSWHEIFVDGSHWSGAGEAVIVRAKQQIDHQLNRVTWSVERASALTLRVECTVHDVLEEVTHGGIGHGVGIKVEIGEVLHHAEEPVGPGERGDTFFELERLPNVCEVVGKLGRGIR